MFTFGATPVPVSVKEGLFAVVLTVQDPVFVPVVPLGVKRIVRAVELPPLSTSGRVGPDAIEKFPVMTIELIVRGCCPVFVNEKFCVVDVGEPACASRYALPKFVVPE